MRAIIAGGGTGGHVIPALAIASELKELFSAQLLFIGTARGIETRLVPNAGFELQLIEVGALKRVSLATRLKTALALPRAIFASSRILRDFRADVVIGVGGYASGPAMLAAALKGIPTLAVEPNAVPGFANRVVAPMISMAAIHFEATARYFRRSVITGIPVRREFFQIPPLLANQSANPTLLLFGGSQGASTLNRVLQESTPELAKRIPHLHIIHQTGQRDYNPVREAYREARISVEVSPFIEDMPHAFARSDLLVCRSGASTVAEVAAAGRPAIFIPFPHATDDHQRRNAEQLSQAGAARLIPESELTPVRFTEEVVSLVSDRARLVTMAEAAKRLSHPHAAAKIARWAARLTGIRVGK